MRCERHWRPFPADPSCVLHLPFYKYGSEQTKILDISGNNNHGVITGAVPYPGNPQMTGIGSTFNRGDFTNGNAFFWSSLNLSPYAGTDLGFTPHYIEVLDAAGKKATGYIGAVGAGETLGAELVVNGTFASAEPPGTAWTRGAGFTVAGNLGVANAVATTIQMYQIAAAAGTLIRKLIKGQLTVASLTAGTGNFMVGEIRYSVLTTTGTFTEYNTVGTMNVYASIQADTAPFTGTFSGYTIKVVTDPPATAVHIVSSLNGTTRAWTSIESGFNPKTIASWKINGVIPRQGIGWYFDDVDDRIVHPSINFGTTHTLIYWIRSFANAKDLIHGGAANNHVAIDGTNIYYNAGATELSQAHGGGTSNHIMIGIVRLGTTVQFFKNGVQVGANQTLDANNDLALTTLGSYNTPGTFLGGVMMEDVGFSRALSEQEIRSFYELTRAKYGV